MTGILLIKDKHNGNPIFNFECDPDQVHAHIDRVNERGIYDFIATYDGKPVESSDQPDWMDRHADKIEAGLSFGKFAGWSIAWAVTVVAAAWFLAWPVEVSGQ